MENKNIDTTLNTLRKHSPNWVDEIRNYINRLEKALTSSNKQIEELKDKLNTDIPYGRKQMYEKVKKRVIGLENTLEITRNQLRNRELKDTLRIKQINILKHQLQKKDNIIKGMNQIIQKKTLTKEQVFGKDKLQTAEKEIKRLRSR